eukprot:3223996-Prymnesium_polylepis.1
MHEQTSGGGTGSGEGGDAREAVARATRSMLQSERISSPPVTLRRPRKRTLEMCTRGAPCVTVMSILKAMLAARIVAVGSPSIHTWKRCTLV